MSAELIENLDIDAYHARKDYLSKSGLSVFAHCPAKFKHQYIDGNDKPDTGQMMLGNAVHLYALQRELFDKAYYIMPDDITRNAKHAAYKEQLEIAAGRIDLKPSEMVQIEGMAKSLRENKKAMLLLNKPGKIEASIFYKDADTGLNIRCRPDFLADDLLLVDLKTTARADDAGFERLSYEKRYDLSVAITARGIKALTGQWPTEYAFLLVETDAPYIIEGKLSFVPWNYQGGKLSKSYFQIGQERLSRLLERYMECKEKDNWPSYNESFMPMTAPEYQIRKLYETVGEYQ
jgi:hypothetical protein